MGTGLLIAGITALLSVGVVGLAVLQANGAKAGVASNAALFKSGGPSLGGEKVRPAEHVPLADAPTIVEAERLQRDGRDEDDRAS